jgi:hypothetical protein
LIITLATRLLFAAYFLEAGLILLVAPWSRWWDRNFFADTLPILDAVLASPYARGAVSGVGLITVLAGLADLGAAFGSRRPTATAAAQSHELPSDR